MYELYYGSEPLHSPLDNVFVLDCTCSLTLSVVSEIKFKLPHDHPMRGKIELLQKDVEIVFSEGGEELFRGRAMQKTLDFWNNETYVCESNLAYLNDIQLRPYSTEDPGMPHDPAGYFQFLVNSYNQYAAAKDSFAIDRNEANRIKPTIDRENSNMVTVRQELKDKMIDPLGGFVRMRYEGGRWFIDYLADGGKENAQKIEFGVNLVDYMHKSSAYERYTAVVPVGKDADGNPVDISSLPDGIVFEGIRKEGDRLIDMEAADKYGIIEYSLSSDAKIPVNIQANGIDFLRTNAMGDTLEIKAVDRHLVDAGIQRIDAGDYLRVVSPPHGIDGYFLCLERTINASDPAQDTFTLGTEQATLTSVQQARIAALNAGIDKTFEEAQGASQAAKDAAKDAADAMEEAGGKARIFTSQPVPPYSVGDLWSQGAGGDILKCERARAKGEEYQANDWMLASKYTDDALAELAKKAAEEAKNKADQAFDDAKDAADKATEAKNAADEATAKTEVVESQVTEVRESAKTAQDAADAAQATADDAKGKAEAAENAAVIAQGAAEAAQGSAQDAATSAGEAVSAANEAKKQIGDVAADAAKIRTDLEGEIASVSTAMQADYAKKTDLTATESKLLTQIEQSAVAIKLEAGQTYAKKTDLADVETSLNAKIEVNASGIEQAVKESTAAKVDASDAKAKADAAQAAAGTASSEAAEAASAASGAQSAADKAKADALAAQQRADAAKAAADKAKEDFDDLSIRADATDEQLAAAQAAVDEAGKAAGTAQSAADAAKSAAGTAQSTADKAKADSATAKAAADAAKAKADEAAEAVAGVANRVTEAETKITQNANAITLRATKAEAQGYASTAKSEAVSAAAGDATTKANSALAGAKTYADAQIKVQADRITSNVTETNGLKSRMSTVEQTASGLSVQLGNVSSAKYLASNYAQPLSTVKTWAAEGHVDNWTVASTSGVRVGDTAYVRMKVSDANVYVYVVVSVTTVTSATAIKGVSHGYVDQSGIDASIAAAAAQTTANTANGTANTAKANAATAQSTANTANSTANTAKTNAATAQSTANTARTEAANAAKTATNYLEYSSAGLDVGNKSSGKWSGFRTRMAASAFQVLDAAGTVLASYGANLVELGKNAKTAVIKLCGGLGTITQSTESIGGSSYSSLSVKSSSAIVVEGTSAAVKGSGDVWVGGTRITPADPSTVCGMTLDKLGVAGLSGYDASVYGARYADVSGEEGVRIHAGSEGFTVNGKTPHLDLGINPIASSGADTVANWLALGNGTAWFTEWRLSGQPTQWGFVQNIVGGSDVFQIWHTQNQGLVLMRSGNSAGWAGSWKSIAGGTEVLFSGTLSRGGSIAVPNASRYNLFVVGFNEYAITGIGTRANGAIMATGSYDNGSKTNMYTAYMPFDGYTLRLEQCSWHTLYSAHGAHSVNYLIGVI